MEGPYGGARALLSPIAREAGQERGLRAGSAPPRSLPGGGSHPVHAGGRLHKQDAGYTYGARLFSHKRQADLPHAATRAGLENMRPSEISQTQKDTDSDSTDMR